MEQVSRSVTKLAAAAAGLFVVVTALYLPARRNGFLYDDYLLILNPDPPHSVADVAALFSRPYYPGLPYYRPVTSASFLIQRSVQGDLAKPFHLGNVLLAGLLAVLTCGLLRRPCFGLAPGVAPAAAAVFVLHPVLSSCVYPISGRDTLLATIGIVAAVWIYLRGTMLASLASAAVFAAGLLTKEAAVVTPGLVALAELTGLSGSPRRSARDLMLRAAPFAGVLALYASLRALLLPGGHLAAGKLLYVPLTYLYALQVTLAPFGALLYEPPVAAWLSPLRLAFVALGLGAAAFAAWRAGPAARASLAFGIGWFVVAPLPTANLLWQETQFDERYVAPAVLGLVLAGASLASASVRGHGTRAVLVAATWTLAAALAVVGLGRGPYFEEVAFYRHWLTIRPDSMTAQYNLANTLSKLGRLDEAVSAYRRALTIEPGHGGAHNNFGETLIKLGKRDDAVAQFREAIRIDARNVKAHNNLGSALALGGNLDGAIVEFREAVRLDPGDLSAMFDLGYALVLEGLDDEAIGRLTEVLRRDPGYAKAHKPLGLALLRRGRATEAAVELEAALRAEPADADARRLLELARRDREGDRPGLAR